MSGVGFQNNQELNWRVMQSDRMEIVQLCELTKIFLQVTKDAWMNTYSGIPYEEFPIRYEHLELFDAIDVIMRNITDEITYIYILLPQLKWSNNYLKTIYKL